MDRGLLKILILVIFYQAGITDKSKLLEIDDLLNQDCSAVDLVNYLFP